MSEQDEWADAAWIAREEADRRRDRFLAPTLARCAARTVLGFHGWRCTLPAGHAGNHHTITEGGCHVYWPQTSTEKGNQ